MLEDRTAWCAALVLQYFFVQAQTDVAKTDIDQDLSKDKRGHDGKNADQQAVSGKKSVEEQAKGDDPGSTAYR